MAQLGFLTDEQETFILNFIIEKLGLKGIKKFAAKLIIPSVLKYLDDVLIVNKTSEKTQSVVRGILVYAMAKDAEGLASYLNTVIDIKMLDEEQEGAIIGTVVKALVLAIKEGLEKINK